MSRQLIGNCVATAQIRGARDYQEDALAVQRLSGGAHASELLLVLADGMGGHAGGEVASRLVVDCFCTAYSSSQKAIPAALRNALDAANECIADAVLDAPELRGMGSTLVGCVIRENRLSWISAGDSPLWVCRDKRLLRLNADHSMVPLLEAMVSRGELAREEMLADPRRSLLRSALAGKTVDLVDLCDQPFSLETNDVVVLASDGVETLAEGEMAALLQAVNDVSLDELAGMVMAGIHAAARPYQDNASVILYHC